MAPGMPPTGINVQQTGAPMFDPYTGRPLAHMQWPEWHVGHAVPPFGQPMWGDAAATPAAPVSVEQAMMDRMEEMSRQRYGGTREEDALIESFNSRGAMRITVPMALAMRAAIPGDVMSGRAVCDVKLRDTTMPGGIARKVEMVAAVLHDKDFFPGEPQIALFMAGRWSRSDGFRPFMFQKMKGWAKHRSFAEDSTVDVAAAGGSRGRAAIRNLPEFPMVTDMERYENTVEGLYVGLSMTTARSRLQWAKL